LDISGYLGYFFILTKIWPIFGQNSEVFGLILAYAVFLLIWALSLICAQGGMKQPSP
jgi:hypothetical protein